MSKKYQEKRKKTRAQRRADKYKDKNVKGKK